MVDHDYVAVAGVVEQGAAPGAVGAGAARRAAPTDTPLIRGGPAGVRLVGRAALSGEPEALILLKCARRLGWALGTRGQVWAVRSSTRTLRAWLGWSKPLEVFSMVRPSRATRTPLKVSRWSRWVRPSAVG